MTLLTLALAALLVTPAAGTPCRTKDSAAPRDARIRLVFSRGEGPTGCGIKKVDAPPVVSVQEDGEVVWDIVNHCDGELEVRVVDKPGSNDVGRCSSWEDVQGATKDGPGRDHIECDIENRRAPDPEDRCAEYRVDWKYDHKLDTLDPILDVRRTDP